jgi:hypothetical protein
MEGVTLPQPLYQADLEEHEVCALSGELRGPDCPSGVHEKFAPGTAPHQQCSMHRPAGTDLGPRFYDWAAHEGVRTLAQPRTALAKAALAFPREGDEFLRGADLLDAFQTIPVRALAPRGGDGLELQLDQGEREPLAAPFSTRIRATPGRHTLKLYRSGSPTPDAHATFTVTG